MTKRRLDVLRGVREILRNRRKWCKGDYYRKGGFCLMGAFNQILRTDPSQMISIKQELQYRKLMGLNVHMVSFNDAKKTTHKDILNALQRGIRAVKRELAKRRT